VLLQFDVGRDGDAGSRDEEEDRLRGVCAWWAGDGGVEFVRGEGDVRGVLGGREPGIVCRCGSGRGGFGVPADGHAGFFTLYPVDAWRLTSYTECWDRAPSMQVRRCLTEVIINGSSNGFLELSSQSIRTPHGEGTKGVFTPSITRHEMPRWLSDVHGSMLVQK